MAIEAQRSGITEAEFEPLPEITAVPDLEEYPQGESASAIEPNHIIDHLAQVDRTMGNLTFLRRVADFESVDGEKYQAGLDEVKLKPHQELGKFWAELSSHRKKQIVLTGAAVLFAAGLGVQLQRNRTQRKKMKRGR